MVWGLSESNPHGFMIQHDAISAAGTADTAVAHADGGACRLQTIRLTFCLLGPGIRGVGAVPHGAEYMNLGGCVALRDLRLAHRLLLLPMLGMALLGGCVG